MRAEKYYKFHLPISVADTFIIHSRFLIHICCAAAVQAVFAVFQSILLKKEGKNKYTDTLFFDFSLILSFVVFGWLSFFVELIIFNMSVGRVLVYGGKGALGAACVSHFKSNNYVSTTTNTFGNTQNNVYCLKT